MIEFGCGYGTFTILAALLVSGRVFALDIEPDVVAETLTRAAAAGLPNVVAEVRDFVVAGCGRPTRSAGYARRATKLTTMFAAGVFNAAWRIAGHNRPRAAENTADVVGRRPR